MDTSSLVHTNESIFEDSTFETIISLYIITHDMKVMFYNAYTVYILRLIIVVQYVAVVKNANYY